MDNQSKTDNPILIVGTDDLFEFDTIEEMVREEWNKLFENADYSMVTGTGQGWQGRREIQPTLIDNDLESFMAKVSGLDGFKFEIYNDRVEISGYHHDGTNYYVCTPFNLSMLTLEQCKKAVEESSLEEDFLVSVRDSGFKELSALGLQEEHEEYCKANLLDKDGTKGVLEFLNTNTAIKADKDSSTAMGLFKIDKKGEVTNQELYHIFFDEDVYDIKEEVVWEL